MLVSSADCVFVANRSSLHVKPSQASFWNKSLLLLVSCQVDFPSSVDGIQFCFVCLDSSTFFFSSWLWRENSVYCVHVLLIFVLGRFQASRLMELRGFLFEE